ncbi:phage holin family protein [Noviherbaspirillum cavernae]|uniref:Phage holin family protein n=1 Tax=Noviherbaspirillum cavernae TaxID=2320862 RepID=A0A418X595_9BURK|nr:phage holin family protein [Noviherbaspirillum cavernae]RJG07551.1 phage holin family protein [Noviherbaspirillum cavernae]
MDYRQSTSSSANSGLIAGAAGIAKNLFGLLVSRIELAALELGEVRGNLARLLLVSAFGIVAFWFALASWTVLLVVLAWDTWGWKILLLIAVVYTLLALAMLFQVRSLLGNGKLSMPATMTELRKDRDALLDVRGSDS